MTTNEESIITKMHQQVNQSLDTISKQDGYKLKYELSHISPLYLQEIDILLTKYKGQKLNTPIAIEVNGQYHYPRNSEQLLGKDIIKAKIIQE